MTAPGIDQQPYTSVRDMRGMAKATLTNIDSGQVVEFMFRPKEIAFAKTNSWDHTTAPGKNMGKAQFQQGQPMTLDLELLFDSYETRTDVRDKTRGLWDMALCDPVRIDNNTEKGSPPHVQFNWGKIAEFTAVITQITQKYTLFLGDGTPVRSVVNISLLQVEETGKYLSQNPTSGGPAGIQTHLVTQGETLDLIAYKSYGDPNAWRFLAEINNIEDPRQLRPGDHLLIAPIP